MLGLKIPGFVPGFSFDPVSSAKPTVRRLEG
jgi:hypothetical protein